MTGAATAAGRRQVTTAAPSALTAMAVGFVTLVFGGGGWRAGFNALWALSVAAAAIEDAFTGRLRDAVVLRGLAVVLAAGVVVAVAERDVGAFVGVVVGALMMSGWMLIVHIVSPGGLGFGDVKFGLLLGCGVGLLAPAGVVVVIVVAVAVQALVTVAHWLPAQRSGCVGPGAAPFGPALAIASLLFVVVVTGLRGGSS